MPSIVCLERHPTRHVVSLRSHKPLIALSFLSLLAACVSDSETTKDDTEITRVESALTITELASPPSYLGTSGGNNCGSAPYSSIGYMPETEGPFPLFLYFVGTDVKGTTPADYAEEQARLVAKAMAERGYFALSVDYDNGLPDVQGLLRKAACLFAPNPATSLVHAACNFQIGNKRMVDCGKGIVTWGHSQGAAMAAVAASYDARVRASWVTGFGQGFGSRPWTITLMLPPARLRLVNAQGDTCDPILSGGGCANDPFVTSEITRRSCAGDADDAPIDCFDPSTGAGWYLVAHDQLRDNPADHCWFYKDGCGASTIHIEPNWSTGTLPFSLGRSADWLKTAAAKGVNPARDLAFDFTGMRAGALTGQYPAGTVDWTGGNFNVAAITPSLFIGDLQNSTNPVTGQFTLWGPQGRMLKTVTMTNSSGSAVDVQVNITRTDGTPWTTVIHFERHETKTDYPFNVANAKTVSFRSPKGATLQLKKFVVWGTAEVAL